MSYFYFVCFVKNKAFKCKQLLGITCTLLLKVSVRDHCPNCCVALIILGKWKYGSFRLFLSINVILAFHHPLSFLMILIISFSISKKRPQQPPENSQAKMKSKQTLIIQIELLIEIPVGPRWSGSGSACSETLFSDLQW